MFNIQIFDYVSHIVRDFVAKHNTSELKITGGDFTLMYALWCQSIDEIETENPQWNEQQKQFCRKAALIAFSKISNDTVYIPLIEKYIKKLKNSDVFK